MGFAFYPYYPFATQTVKNGPVATYAVPTRNVVNTCTCDPGTGQMTCDGMSGAAIGTITDGSGTCDQSARLCTQACLKNRVNNLPSLAGGCNHIFSDAGMKKCYLMTTFGLRDTGACHILDTSAEGYSFAEISYESN